MSKIAAMLGPECCFLRTPVPEIGVPTTPQISVVDDDDSMREALRGLLRSTGFAVQAFASARDFLGSPYLAFTSCLIVDINMPVMTGLDLYRHLTSSGRNIPTILITATPDDAHRKRALSDGVICYLGKPCSEDRLLACVRAALARGEPSEKRP
jgi:FixJ family two-component response regulator